MNTITMNKIYRKISSNDDFMKFVVTLSHAVFYSYIVALTAFEHIPQLLPSFIHA
jgi:hypothetical protein